MTEARSRERRRPSRREGRRLRGWPLVVVTAAAAIVIFAVGIAFGQALSDSPPPPSTGTFVRTLEPLPQQPATAAP